MRWLEVGLRAILTISLFGLIVLYDPAALPIVELALAIIIVSLYLFTNLPYPDEATRQTRHASRRLLLYSFASVLVTLLLPLSYFFWPLYTYQYLVERTYQQVLVILVPLLMGLLLGYPLYLCLSITGLSLILTIFHTYLERGRQFEHDSYEEIDTLRHLNERFRQEQHSLLALQDDRVHESIRQERRRLVEEIHDALGHQLSSAVIQIAALEYLSEEGEVKEALTSVKEVLNTSMANVREIIHTERRTTLDLKQELQALVDNFTKCPINFTFTNHQPMTNQVAHSVVNIVKEALTNINKHSNASLVTLRFVVLDKQWTLLIVDNGDQTAPNNVNQPSSSGIGLLNIEERINKLAGTLHINQQNGFRIFITIPIQEDS